MTREYRWSVYKSLVFLLATSLLEISATAYDTAHAIDTSLKPTAHVPGNGTQSNSQWLTYNNDFGGQRFSALDKIDSTNVASLIEICRVQVGEVGAFQSGLIVVDDIMYLTTNRETIALDSTNCAVKWRKPIPVERREVFPVNRGVAYFNHRLFRGTSDGMVVAIDADTGQTLWKNFSADPLEGEFFSSSPLAWEGLVFIGIAGSDWGIRGRIMAFDAATGRRVWQFHTIPMAGERGAATWKDSAAAPRGGGGTWSTYTLDISSGELFVPIGNPAPDLSPSSRPGANLFTDAFVVLDAQSGALKWWYQLVSPDGLDFDLAAAPMLYHSSGQQKRVAAAGKDGFLHVVDRETHKLLFKVATTTIKNNRLIPNLRKQVVCPGPIGGTEWNGPAFDSINNQILVGSIDACATYESGLVRYVTGVPFYGGTFDFIGPRTGWLTAMDGDTGEVRWKYHADTPIAAGITPTAGGLVFAGDIEGNLLAFESSSGRLLKKLPTGGALAGGIITYMARGTQIIAAATGNISRLSVGGSGTPTVVLFSAAQASSSTFETGDNLNTHNADKSSGKAVFIANCVACHGLNGSALSAHDLRGIGGRLSFAQTLERVVNPKAPMPKLYPGVLGKVDLEDVVAYVRSL